MKRSGSLRLTLLTGTLPLALTACDNPAINGQQDPNGDWQASQVETAAPVDCSTVELMQTDACKADLERVLDESPKYGSGDECRAATGADCQQVRYNGQSTWMSPLTGFVGGMILSNLIDEIGDRHRRGYRYAPYGSYRGGYRTAPSYPSAGAPPPPPPTRAITQSRSGFGSTSSARSSFGRGWGG